jgi:hypothetical protein
MPIAGIGLHVLIALFFAVHVVRSGQQIYWLFILFAFPLLGSVVYFLAVYLPNSRLQRGARKVVSAAARSLDPTRQLRDARSALDLTPTAQNRMRLAAALLDAGMPEEAATHYEACVNGPFASDLEIRLGAARAYLACERPAEAIVHLDFIRSSDPGFRPEQVSLLMAHALSADGRSAEARSELEAAVTRFGSFESRAEYAIWACNAGDRTLAGQLQIEIQRSMDRWNRHTRELNLPLVHRPEAAYALVKARA